MNSNGSLNRRASSSSGQRGRLKFPDFHDGDSVSSSAIEDGRESPSLGLTPAVARLHSGERRQGRREQSMERTMWTNSKSLNGGKRHGRQRSLTEAIRTVRTRSGSVSQNAAVIADSLKAPVSYRLVLLCLLWYACSILSNASSKAILTALPRPITLTVVQFLFVSGWCVVASHLARFYRPLRMAVPVLRSGIRAPTRELITATLPLTAFQIGGHILNSDAMSRIPVSLVHTIKGLSPLLTVLAYRIFFSVHYSLATYASLVPLTVGVVMACAASFRVEFIGLLNAFGSALLFVTQNIVSKKLFTEAAKAELDGAPVRLRKPDKLNLLCYSSGLALLFTLPLWLWGEGFVLIRDFLSDASVELSGRPGSLDHGRLALEFFFNGTFHFTQSLVAFVLLGLTSPVTYSVASLIKRVFVIVFAILWFGNPMSVVQASGIGLTIIGLYLYDRISDADRADRKLREKEEGTTPLLPLNTGVSKRDDGFVPSPINASGFRPLGSPLHEVPLEQAEVNREDGLHTGADEWLRAGVTQEDTWKTTDHARLSSVGVR